MIKDIPFIAEFRASLRRAYEEDQEAIVPTALMVVKAAEPTSTASTATPSTESEQLSWTAGNKKFPSTALRLLQGKTWMNATLENPEYFFAAYESKKNPKYLAEYVEWVKQHYDVDTHAKRLTRRVARTLTPEFTGGLATDVPPPPVA